jgi:hypothetical protein
LEDDATVALPHPFDFSADIFTSGPLSAQRHDLFPSFGKDGPDL